MRFLTPLCSIGLALLLAPPSFAMDPFTDVSVASGTLLYSNSALGAGVAMEDMNGDGLCDILVIDGQGDPNRAYRNNGDLTFTDCAPGWGLNNNQWGKTLVPTDYDNDGDFDLLLTNFSATERNRLYRNEGWEFSEVTLGSGFDFDDRCTGAAWADYDSDGWLDCYVTVYGAGGRNRLLRNLGNGTFQDLATALGVDDEPGWGNQPVWFDYDNDGDSDLYVGNDATLGESANKLFRNEGNGSFTDVSVASGAGVALQNRGLAVGDYDNDGDLDLYLTNSNAGNVLLRNNGDGTFFDVPGAGGLKVFLECGGCLFFDYDNDGWLDVYVCAINENPGDAPGAPNRLYWNNHNGNFIDISTVTGVNNAGASYGSAVGDYDKDGDLDLYVTNEFTELPQQPNALYANQHATPTTPRTDFLRVKLRGTTSNRSAVGARVTIQTETGTQIREGMCGSSFLSSSESILHFGLGSASTVNTLTVRWPSGIIESFNNLDAGQEIVIVENESPGLFRDVTAEVGTQVFSNSTWGAGVAMRDLEGDGDLDLFVVDGQGDPNKVFRNNGNRTFTDIAADIGLADTGWGKALAPADFDNDGDLDLLLTNYSHSETNRLWRNDGGTFVDITAGSGFDYIDECTGAAWADYDGDSDLDCYITTYAFTHRNRLMRNEGGGVFTNVAPALGVEDATGWGYQPAWFDYDNDGDSDLYVGNDNFFGGTTNRLYRNEGNGTFTDVSVASGANVGLSTMGIAIGDYDRDGDLDVYMSNIPTGNFLLRNNGDGTFANVAEAAGVAVHQICWGVDWIDHDNDGWLDLYACVMNEVMSNINGGANFFFRNQRDGTFENISLESRTDNGGITFSSAVGDYDNDGDQDLYITNWLQDAGDPPNAMYENRHIERDATGSDYLRVKLVGTVSNRDAVGSRVTITSDNGTQIAELQSGTSYLSSAEPVLHFGLGSATTVSSLTVRWPSGLTSTVANIAGGQTIALIEGGAAAADETSSLPAAGIRAIVPNPSGDLSEVQFYAPGALTVAVSVYDASGRMVRSLVPGGKLAQGLGRAQWDGRNQRGVEVAAGTYFVRLTADGRTLGTERILRVE